MCKFYLYAGQRLQGFRVDLLLFQIYPTHVKSAK
jgi:hypothetical protein